MISLQGAVAVWLSLGGVPGAGPLIGIEHVFDRPAALAQAGPVVCILDTEHPDVVREKLRQQPVELYKGRVLKGQVAELTGLACVLLHYSEAKPDQVDRSNVKAILLMARRGSMDASLDRELFSLIRDTKIPLIGLCGGHQMIAQAFGGEIGKMRPLLPGEPDPHPQYHPGDMKEWGFMKVRVTMPDPLFEGLAPEIVVRQMHAWEIKKLPAEFVVLAATDECEIQAIRHRFRPLYGTQFHAEAYDDQHPDGRKILGNFFKIAGIEKK